MLVEVPCGYQTVDVDSSRLERSGGEGTAIVLMSGSDDGGGSLVAVLLMFAFVGVLIGVLYLEIFLQLKRTSNHTLLTNENR